MVLRKMWMQILHGRNGRRLWNHFQDKELGESFLKRIRLPDGKTANIIAFLKFLNLLRIPRR